MKSIASGEGRVEDIRRVMELKRNIRNISVIGHVDHGKSTLVDLLLGRANQVGNTAKSSAISIHYDVPDEFLKGFMGERSGNEYLINLIDTPGHSELSSEVTTALRITDGALVIVDCIDGVSLQAETLVRQSLGERVRPALIINKMDRCFLELQVDGEEAYQMCLRAVQKINDVMATYQDPSMGEVQVCPGKGTVAFAAGVHGWAFTLADFAKIYALRKPGTDVRIFMEKLWGDNFYDPATKKWTTTKTGSATCRRGFVQFCYEPIQQIISTCMENQKDKLWPMLAKLGISMKNEEEELTDKPLMKHVMQTWLPASSALLEMMIFHLPSPLTAQRYRVEHLYEGPLDDQYANAIRDCDPEGPLMLYVSKLIPDPDTGKFLAFGRVFSGKVSTGLKVRIMGPNYVPGENKDLYVQSVARTLIWVGSKQKCVKEDVPCGNIVAVRGLCKYISKSATVTNEREVGANPIRAMNFSVSPLMRVAVQCVVASDLPKLVDGLKKLSKSDPIVVCSPEESGENIIATAGEFHLKICLKDLQDNLMDGVEITHGVPVVSYCETVLEKSSHTVMRQSTNRHNRIYMEARPLEEGLADAIDEGRIGPKVRSNTLTEEFHWDRGLGKSIWAFGPDNTGPNMILDMCKGVHYLNEIKESVVAGFQNVSKEGALAREKLRGVCFEVCDVLLHADAIHRRPGQIIPTAERVMYDSQLTAKPRFLEPVYSFEMQAPEGALDYIFPVFYAKRGKIIDVKRNGNPFYNISGYLPVAEAYQFTAALRDATAGAAGQMFPQFAFDHWQLVPSDPLQAGSKAADIAATLRKAKGLNYTIAIL